MDKRKLIKLQTREARHLERIGIRDAFRISNSIRVGVIRSYTTGQPVGEAIAKGVARFTPIINKAITAAYLQGRLRSIYTLVTAKSEKKKTLYSSYDEALGFCRRRMELTEEQLLAVRNNYGEIATQVTKSLGDEIEKRAQKSIERTLEKGMHVREGVKDLRQQFEDMGITPTQSHLFETLVRTQTQMAYGAGRWQANQDPAIQEILWGYEYVTVGDDRVRPSHEAMDGTKLEKDSPEWQHIWPPNGYNCRCSTIEIFDEGVPVPPPETTTDDRGQEIIVQPDKGFSFNPGAILPQADMPPASVKGKSTIKKKAETKEQKLLKKSTAEIAVKDKQIRSMSKQQATAEHTKIRAETLGKAKKYENEEQWAKSLTKEQKSAITNYTGDAYANIKKTQESFNSMAPGKISAVLKKKTGLPKDLKQAMEIEKTLLSAPQYDKKIYRGLKLKTKADIKKFEEIWTKGKEISFDSIQSFSGRKAVAEGFAYTPKGKSVIIEMKKAPRSSANIAPISKGEGVLSEAEVLVGSNGKYKIKSVTQTKISGGQYDAIRVVIEEII